LQLKRIIILLILGIAGAGLWLGSLYLFGDRPDESRTTGTQLRLTEKDRVEIEAMRKAMKSQ